MRKTTLVAAAILAAGLAASQAQNVYSLNVVGYVNIALKPGYNLISPQLVDTANPTAPINPVLTGIAGLPDGSTFFGWDETGQTFTPAANWVGTPPDGPAWYNDDYTALVTMTAPRGKSYFIYNGGASDAAMTLVGEVPQGANTQTVPNNYGFLADFVPVSQDVAVNGFPVADGSTVQSWDAAGQTYTAALNGVATPPDGPAFYNDDYTAVIPFAPQVGQGFLYFTTTGSATWNRSFTVPAL